MYQHIFTSSWLNSGFRNGQVLRQVCLSSMICEHLALKGNEPGICAIKGVFPQQENKFPFLANSFPLQKLQQLSKMSLQFPLACFLSFGYFFQLSEDMT